ncbi:MAG: RIP metalloprotease RseP [Alphaproteobacteria bacterium]|nr:RIP metalloprotease RseP [Alphaproteobacteria bacterium]
MDSLLDLLLLRYIVPFLAVLTVLVFVHELGHYLVARACGVRVLVFSIGFGRELYGWNDRAGTRWKIGALPLGGYVKFFGDSNAASAQDTRLLDEMAPAAQKISFHHKSLAQRAAIVAAGPIANFVYAILVLALLFMAFGQRVTPPEIGRVLPGGVAEKAGLQAGDVVRQISGRRVERFEEIEEAVLLNPDRPQVWRLDRQGLAFEVKLTPSGVERSDLEGLKRRYGDAGILPANPAVVGEVRAGTPAAAAGFQPGDRIVAANGRPIDSFEMLQDAVAASGGRSITLSVLRQGERLDLVTTPKRETVPAAGGGGRERWLIGIQRAPRPLLRLSLGEAVVEAARTSYDLIDRTLGYLGEMITGQRGTEDLGGPLRIAHASGQAAQLGWEQVVMLSVLLSLNLGLINLFPIPILDGGHLLLYACEAVRGRPLTERMQDFAFRFGLALIAMLAVFATWNDLVNLSW